jgi:hypothetical protein
LTARLRIKLILHKVSHPLMTLRGNLIFLPAGLMVAESV